MYSDVLIINWVQLTGFFRLGSYHDDANYRKKCDQILQPSHPRIRQILMHVFNAHGAFAHG